MKVLLLTIAPKNAQKMNKDIAYEFFNDGHTVYIVCPEDAHNPATKQFIEIDGINYLFVKSGNAVGKVGLLKKVKNFLLVDTIYKNALKKSGISGINLVLYSTPPITLVHTIEWAKNAFNADTYLMLKDIFPQNAVDIGMMKKSGLMGIAYRYFRKKEKKLYTISDYIGCMSQANINYILKHNPEIPHEKVGICVNSYKLLPVRDIDVTDVRNRYSLPDNAVVFLYGGNLGKPQGLNFFVEILKANKNKSDRYFLVCGDGKDQDTIKNFISSEKPQNVRLMPKLPADDFDELSRACDVGLVFLNSMFTIPNFPSRMLSIMINEKPILAATDSNTDVGEIVESGNMGWWCESTNVTQFNGYIDMVCMHPDILKQKGINARKYYETHYTSDIAYKQILEGLKKVDSSI